MGRSSRRCRPFRSSVWFMFYFLCKTKWKCLELDRVQETWTVKTTYYYLCIFFCFFHSSGDIYLDTKHKINAFLFGKTCIRARPLVKYLGHGIVCPGKWRIQEVRMSYDCSCTTLRNVRVLLTGYAKKGNFTR